MKMLNKISVFFAIIVTLCCFFTYSPKTAKNALAAEKRVWLTFDDGPSDSVTPLILDVLAENNVKATFFVVGKAVKGREDIVKRIDYEGHSIGLHSYSHNYGEIYSSPQALLKDIEKCQTAVQAAVPSFSTKLYRFPGGSHYVAAHLKNAVLQAGYKHYDWTASCRDEDVKGASKNALTDFAIKTSNGQTKTILLLHDSPSRKTTAEALPDIIKYYKVAGYKFCTL